MGKPTNLHGQIITQWIACLVYKDEEVVTKERAYPMPLREATPVMIATLPLSL
jgi:hypothetical protein